MARLFGDAYPQVNDEWLRRALELAELGRGCVSPNPLVGCVIVRDGEVVGEGFHQRAGLPHAEANALVQAGEKARGATAYVTLEPCNHVGRTPPCAPALIKAGVARVVIGMPDPNTEVPGGGAAVLQAAGVDVEFAQDSGPYEELNAGWITCIRASRPFVRVKLALTLDGHAAVRPGVRATISGTRAARITSRLRREADAVMVGRGTVVADDPALTVRDETGAAAKSQPLRVVLCGTEAPPSDARLLTDGAGDVAVLVPASLGGRVDEIARRGVRVLRYDAGAGLAGALQVLCKAGVVELLVEAGARLFTSLWDADLIDELIVYHAGSIAGSQAPALHVSGSTDGCRLDHRMCALEVGVAGGDVVSVWRRASDPALRAGSGHPRRAQGPKGSE